MRMAPRPVRRAGPVTRQGWARRIAIALLTAIVLLGLFDVFGQGAVTTTARTPAAAISVNSPARARGGLLFTTQIVVRAIQPVGHLRLVLSDGWFEGMTFNGLAPQPAVEKSLDGSMFLGYGKLNPGEQLTVWISWQVNPTSAGLRTQDVTVLDGERTLVAVHRTLTIFP